MKEYTGHFNTIEAFLLRNKVSMTLRVCQGGKRIDQLVELARKNAIPVTNHSSAELDALVADHRGVVLELQRDMSKPDLKAIIDKAGEQSLIIILEGITDPQNSGAIIRSADLFSADAVLLPARRTAKPGQVMASSSAGALAWVPVCEDVNLPRAVELLKKNGYWVYCADLEGEDPARTNLKGRVALILGSEGKGPGRLLRDLSDQVLTIPMSGHLDSLNVSVAAGILMYEIRRQQR